MEADTNLKLVPCKCGCEGCYYEHEFDCPWDKDKEACVVDGTNMIFVKKEQNDE